MPLLLKRENQINDCRICAKTFSDIWPDLTFAIERGYRRAWAVIFLWLVKNQVDLYRGFGTLNCLGLFQKYKTEFGG